MQDSTGGNVIIEEVKIENVDEEGDNAQIEMSVQDAELQK